MSTHNCGRVPVLVCGLGWVGKCDSCTLHRQTGELSSCVVNTLVPKECWQEFCSQRLLNLGEFETETVGHALQELPFLLQ
jgi:hypothetical protein